MQILSDYAKEMTSDLIILAMKKGLSKAFIDSIENSHNPYEKDNTSDLILDIVLRKLDQIDLKKHFFDL